MHVKHTDLQLFELIGAKRSGQSVFLQVLEPGRGSCEPKNRKVGFPFAREHFGTDCEGQARIRIHEEKPDFSVHLFGIRPLQRK